MQLKAKLVGLFLAINIPCADSQRRLIDPNKYWHKVKLIKLENTLLQNDYTMNYDLLEYARRVGPMYGVEDFSLFLYSLARMHKPEVVLELGTGSAVCALLCAQALQENGRGKVWSVDDGRQWEALQSRAELGYINASIHNDYNAFLTSLKSRFGLDQTLEFVEQSYPPLPSLGKKIDLLFADFESHPAALMKILAHYLPQMSDAASIFIDGVPTYLPSFLLMEKVVGELNAGKVPAGLIREGSVDTITSIEHMVHTKRFILVNLTEVKDRTQNSTAWLKIEPIDDIPYPKTRMS